MQGSVGDAAAAMILVAQFRKSKSRPATNSGCLDVGADAHVGVRSQVGCGGSQHPILAIGREAYSEIGRVTSRSVQIASYRLDKGTWSPGGDYLPVRDQLLISKPEVHTTEWSAA
jgi:hypothetical protein